MTSRQTHGDEAPTGPMEAFDVDAIGKLPVTSEASALSLAAGALSTASRPRPAWASPRWRPPPA